MSQSDNFDTDIGAEQEPVRAPEQEEQDQDQAPEQPQEEQAFEEQQPKKSMGGLLVKGVIALAVVGGIGFYFLRPSGVQLPDDTSMPVAQMEPQPATTAIAPAPSTPLPEAVPIAATPAEIPASETMPETKLSDAAPAAPAATETVAGADPLAWDAPAAKDSAPPTMMPTVDSSSAPVTPAATDSNSAPAMPAEAVPAAEKAAPAQEIPKASEASPGKIDALEKRLAALEETIAVLQAKMPMKENLESLAATVGRMQQEQEAAQANAAAEEKAKAETAAAAKTQAKTKVKARSAAPKVKGAKAASTPSLASSWVLKSAKPGMAWVAERGSGEMSTVTVGSMLRGVGRVTSIEKDSSGRWVVNGTAGRISQ